MFFNQTAWRPLVALQRTMQIYSFSSWIEQVHSSQKRNPVEGQRKYPNPGQNNRSTFTIFFLLPYSKDFQRERKIPLEIFPSSRLLDAVEFIRFLNAFLSRSRTIERERKINGLIILDPDLFDSLSPSWRDRANRTRYSISDFGELLPLQFRNVYPRWVRRMERKILRC